MNLPRHEPGATPTDHGFVVVCASAGIPFTVEADQQALKDARADHDKVMTLLQK